MKQMSKRGLPKDQLEAIMRTLPGCRISVEEVEERVSTALSNYSFAVIDRLDAEFLRKARSRRLSALKAARTVQDFMATEEFALLEVTADFSEAFTPQELGAFIRALEDCERFESNHGRGASVDRGLDALFAELADIYTDATGRPPSSSRTTSRPEPHGSWVDFGAAVLARDDSNEPIATKGRPLMTKEAFDTRWRRRKRGMGTNDQQKSIHDNARHESDCDSVSASTTGGADAKRDRSTKRNGRGRARTSA